MASFLDIVKKVLPIIVLLFILLFLLTWLNLVHCSDIIGWCTIYYKIKGPPSILIVYGTDGLGDPFKLQALFEDREKLNIRTRPKMRPLEYVTDYSKIKGFDMVIVDRAKTMSFEQMKIFINYARMGGKLVWIADSGTSLPNGETMASKKDLGIDESSDPISPWIRIKEDEIINLEEILNLRYIDNFCKIKPCKDPDKEYVGKIIVNESHPLTYRMQNGKDLYGDLALVKAKSAVSLNMPLVLDYQSEIIDSSGKKYGKIFPIIATSGVGGRIVYYAVPPENFFDYSLPNKNFKNTGMEYGVLVEDLYTGMFT